MPSLLHETHRREVPLGRSALWACVGYGIGAATVGFLYFVLGLKQAEFSTGLVIVWPLLIGLMGMVLLMVGTMPAHRIAISVAAAEYIEEHGVMGVARIRHVTMTQTGSLKTVSVSLDARWRKERNIRSELVWKLSAIDALKMTPGAIIPVRIDPDAPSRIVFDTRANLQNRTGIDPNEAFSVRNRFLERLATFRPASAVAMGLGLLVGALIALLT